MRLNVFRFYPAKRCSLYALPLVFICGSLPVFAYAETVAGNPAETAPAKKEGEAADNTLPTITLKASKKNTTA